jgi:hypothetical protein
MYTQMNSKIGNLTRRNLEFESVLDDAEAAQLE